MLNVKTSVEIVPSKVGASYPYFGMHTVNGMIVLFISKSTGVCLSKGTSVSSAAIGEYYDSWIEDIFKPIEVQEIVFKITDNS